jgi:hypothetical protein
MHVLGFNICFELPKQVRKLMFITLRLHFQIFSVCSTEHHQFTKVFTCTLSLKMSILLAVLDFATVTGIILRNLNV